MEQTNKKPIRDWWWKTKWFSWDWKQAKDVYSLTSIQHYTGGLSVIRQGKAIQLGKEEIKLFSDMIVYLEKSKESTKKLLELINEFGKVAGTKLIHRNLLHPYTLTVKYQK